MPSKPDTQPTSPPQQRQKRNRALLSCGPCRASKLKCDRMVPCSQCTKKGRDDLCAYAPKPIKKKPPAKGMSARLQRLEGMVRSMMDSGGEVETRERDGASEAPPVLGNVVRGDKGTTYVGATHCMAMLEDIEDLKSYFIDSDNDEDGDASPTDEIDGPEMLLWPRGGPVSKEELLAQLPERQVADRLITRYFASLSPSQHVIHRPTFAKTYAGFWQDPSSVSYHWISQLFMVLALGILFNSFSAPHEVEGDSSVPISDRIRQYRSCAGWALIWGKYTQPTIATLPAFLLYVEAHFLFNRAVQMNCYVLSGMCIRLMLKMGLHRDPSKLTGISPFEGEMRRRMWNMAVQIETIVSFHMGLPSILQGVESDTTVPRNLQDEDFDQQSTALPPSRPVTDHTLMTYPIHKTNILRVFAKIARQAHALTPPSYAKVMKLDRLLHETWEELPPFMQARPLEECVGDSPTLIMQRFGLTAIYNKSRCVLHRRYLAERVHNPEHDFSRRQCIRGATILLENQYIIWKACKPGNLLSHNGWFVSSLAIHDYLLAAVIIYLIIQNMEVNSKSGIWDEVAEYGITPTREELISMIKRSHAVWTDAALKMEELRKTADTLATILAKVGSPVDRYTGGSEITADPPTAGSGYETSLDWPSATSKSSTMVSSNESAAMSSFDPEWAGPTPSSMDQHALGDQSLEMATMGETLPSSLDFDASWMSADSMDWRYLDISLAHSHTAGTTAGPGPTWMERLPLDDIDAMGPAAWNN
ncbi:hypothetical protein HIM_06444 [Hirsutella minnesotensis 3608]|uniref:Zn(2)-C6 fungal-type domain-containing protein n=1 Tax=Hirsutella minnesotensis 3608 TaxID=1043627 RepID=A0A0F7ZU43_9HYPO|nr:hypothetical protein HIM_06444 [Hirsutella minnesotensis 3608]